MVLDPNTTMAECVFIQMIDFVGKRLSFGVWNRWRNFNDSLMLLSVQALLSGKQRVQSYMKLIFDKLTPGLRNYNYIHHSFIGLTLGFSSYNLQLSNGVCSNSKAKLPHSVYAWVFCITVHFRLID